MGQNILQSLAYRYANYQHQLRQKRLAAKCGHPLALSQLLRHHQNQHPGAQLMYIKRGWPFGPYRVSRNPPLFNRESARNRYLELLESMGIQTAETMGPGELIWALYAIGEKQMRDAENDAPQAAPAAETVVVADPIADAIVIADPIAHDTLPQDPSPSEVGHESGRRRALDAQHVAAYQQGRGWGAQE